MHRQARSGDIMGYRPREIDHHSAPVAQPAPTRFPRNYRSGLTGQPTDQYVPIVRSDSDRAIDSVVGILREVNGDREHSRLGPDVQAQRSVRLTQDDQLGCRRHWLVRPRPKRDHDGVSWSTLVSDTVDQCGSRGRRCGRPGRRPAPRSSHVDRSDPECRAELLRPLGRARGDRRDRRRWNVAEIGREVTGDPAVPAVPGATSPWPAASAA